jgi:hypothetical protein
MKIAMSENPAHRHVRPSIVLAKLLYNLQLSYSHQCPSAADLVRVSEQLPSWHCQRTQTFGGDFQLRARGRAQICAKRWPALILLTSARVRFSNFIRMRSWLALNFAHTRRHKTTSALSVKQASPAGPLASVARGVRAFRHVPARLLLDPPNPS